VLAPAVALYSLAITRGRPQQLVGAVAAVAAVIVADAHCIPGARQFCRRSGM
jgi:hypothetical protein